MYSLFSQLTLHYPLHISQTLYFCHLFKVFLYVFHSLCCNILWAAEPLQTFSLKFRQPLHFSSSVQRAVLYCIQNWILPSNRLHFSKNNRVFWGHRVWWGQQRKCFILTRADYPTAREMETREKKKQGCMQRCVSSISNQAA